MKIYSFSCYTSQKEPAAETMKRYTGGGNPLRKAAGGEDMVEISTEAMKKFRNTRASINNAGDTGRLVNFPEVPSCKILRLRESVRNSEYDFDSSRAITRSAEEILRVFLPEEK